MCKAVERMIGIEVIESAVEDAKFNAELNKYDNNSWINLVRSL